MFALLRKFLKLKNGSTIEKEKVQNCKDGDLYNMDGETVILIRGELYSHPAYEYYGSLVRDIIPDNKQPL